MSSWYFLPLYFQAAREASPSRSGLLILPTVVVQAFVGVAAGYLMNATGRRLLLIYCGMALMTLGFGLFTSLAPNTTLIKVVALEVVAGMGVGLVFQAPLLALQARIPPEHLAAGTALFGFIRSISTSISVVIGSVVFQGGMSRRRRSFSGNITKELLSEFSGNSAFVNVALVSELKEPEKTAVKTLYSNSLRDMWILYASAAAIGLLVSFAIKSEALSVEIEDTKPPSPVATCRPVSRSQTEIEL